MTLMTFIFDLILANAFFKFVFELAIGCIVACIFVWGIKKIFDAFV